MKIIKLGGGAITEKEGFKKARLNEIRKLAQAIAEVWKNGMRDIVLVHGAGSFGHALVLKHSINEGVNTDDQKLGYADTHAACSELSLLIVNALIDEGIPAISISPSALIKQSNKRIIEFREDVITEYLSKGYLPVLYGDMVPDDKLGGSVCSGDQIMAWLGKNAEFLVFATNVDGVLDDKGELIPEITKENFDEISKHLKETPHDVTGAMKGKIGELLGIGTTAYIVNAAHSERITALIEGRGAICTTVHS
jgi:isopentenyl phosphate kinase